MQWRTFISVRCYPKLSVLCTGKTCLDSNLDSFLYYWLIQQSFIKAKMIEVMSQMTIYFGVKKVLRLNKNFANNKSFNCYITLELWSLSGFPVLLWKSIWMHDFKCFARTLVFLSFIQNEKKIYCKNADIPQWYYAIMLSFFKYYFKQLFSFLAVLCHSIIRL